MAINLGAMISAARSQKNPSGDFITNALAGNEYKMKMMGEQAGLGENNSSETVVPQSNAQQGGISSILANIPAITKLIAGA